MTEPIDPPAYPEEEPLSDSSQVEPAGIETPPDGPARGASVRPPGRRIGPRSPERSVAQEMPELLESGWATVAFMFGMLSLLGGLIVLCVWGVSALQTYSADLDQQALIERTEFTLPEMTYDQAFALLNDLRPLETDDERSQDLIAGFANGELGTDEATASDLTKLLERVARASRSASDPIHRHLSRPHLIRRILPIVPEELRSDFALDPERIMEIGYDNPVVLLVRVRPWDTGNSHEVGQVVYAYLRHAPEGTALPFRFWVVREADGWHCVDYELTFYGVSTGEMSALKICTMICPGDKNMEILQRISDWVDPKSIQDPQKDLDWIVANIRQLPPSLRDWNMLLSLQSLHDAGLKDDQYNQGIADLPASTRSTMRGDTAVVLHFAAGRWEAVLKECDSYRARFGEASPRVTIARAKALVALGRFDEAIQDLELISQRLPTEDSVIFSLALACHPGKLTPLISAVLQHPQPSEAIRQGYYALSTACGTDSLRQFTEALSQDARLRADTARLRSWLALRVGDTVAAIESMRKAVEFSDETRRDEFQNDLFYLMLTNGQAAQACGLFNDDAKLIAALMEALNEESWPDANEQVQQLVDALKRVVAARPQDHEAWYLLGYARNSQKEWDEALSAFAQSLQVQPLDKAANPDQSPLELERQKLAYYDWIFALQSASRWSDLEQAIEKDVEVVENLSPPVAWAKQDDFVAWVKRFAEQHTQASYALSLQLMLAEQAEDWGAVREHLANLIMQEKDNDKKDRLRRRLAVAIVKDPDLEKAVNDLRSPKVLDFAGQILLQNRDTRRLPHLIAAVKASNPPRGIRSRLPFWEAHAWAQLGRFKELNTPAIQKSLAKPAEGDVVETLSLVHKWDGQTPGPEPFTIKTLLASAEDNDQDREQLASAVRRGDIGSLRNLLADGQHHETLQELYLEPAYAALWSPEFRPIRELAPPRLASLYRTDEVVLLQSGDALNSTLWESRLKDLSTVFGKEVELVSLNVAEKSPARQVHRVQAGDQECFVAMGVESASDFELQDSESRLKPEHKSLLKSHRWWIQAWPAQSDSSVAKIWSEAVAAALVGEQTIAIYHNGDRKAFIQNGTENFRLAALEIHRFSQSHLPWSGLECQKLRQPSGITEEFWWHGPERATLEPEVRFSEPISLFERYRSCTSDQIVRAVIQDSIGWLSESLEVDVEQCVINGGVIQEIRCRVVTPSRLYPRLTVGEPILVPQYQFSGMHTVSRLADRQPNP